jgi:hypothetical protein
MHAYKTYAYEIHACKRHVHKSAGVYLIGVYLRFRFFNLGFWERFPIPPYPFVWGKYAF